MKKIFNWMREQISDHLNHCREMEAQSRTKFEEFGYGSRVDAYNRAIEYINKAETKWESDCCEWKQVSYSYHIYESSCGESDEYCSDWKFCPYCGKPIKISEVE